METGINVSEMKKDGPMISVIVPVYNIENDLPDCLNSICHQTYKNIEVILVDDGSEDHSGIIADQYAGMAPFHIKVIHQENQGVARARLNGLKVASGEWIGFVDGDDWIEPDMFTRLLKNALNYRAEISHCGYQTNVNKGERIHYYYNTGRVVFQEGNDGVRDLLDGSFIEPGLCNKLFHRDLLHELFENYDENWNIRVNEDLLMNYFLFRNAERIIYEDFCPYHYMVRPTSVTRSGFRDYKVLDPVRARKIILKEADSEIKEVAWRQYLVSCINAYEVFCRMDGEKDKKKTLRCELKKNRDKWVWLKTKERLKVRMLLSVPAIYLFFYNLYVKIIRTPVYE